jgi:GTPase Era involved in 16S rRNA processing
MNCVNRINIAILGNVSSGKSTLLNSLLLEEFASMDISRNTMIPQIYHELENNKFKNIKEAKQINVEISSKNDLIKEKTNNPDYDISLDMEPMEFYIHKLKELKICQKDISMSFYDIPGLNDNKNHKQYYDYVKKNFNNFDIIIYLIDLTSGLNTKDEIDLLKFISKYSLQMNKFVIPVINKSDDMTMNNGNLISNPKYYNNYVNILNELNNYKKNYPNEKFQDPILYSARESYIYRMLLKDPNFELSESLVDIIGFNDMGKKYYTLTNEERIIKIKKIVNDSKFLDTMIKMSGYFNFYDMLKNVLNEKNQKDICEKKIFLIYTYLDNIDNTNTENIFDIFSKFSNILNTNNKLNVIFNNQINKFDEDKFINNKFDSMISKIDVKKIEDLVKLKNCLDKINLHDDYKKYLTEKINNSYIMIKEHVYNYYLSYYDFEYNLSEMNIILKTLKHYSIDKLDLYVGEYLEKIKLNSIDLYHNVDYSNFNSIIEFDSKYRNELKELKEYVNNSTINSVYKFIVKNKIYNLTQIINLDKENKENKENCVIILYNLMLFYNYYSTKKIEYSEIYTLLLSNYIQIMNKNTLDQNQLEKHDDLLLIDNDYVSDI